MTSPPSNAQVPDSASDEIGVALKLMREQRTAAGDNVKPLCDITCSRDDMKIYMDIAKKLASLRCADGSVPIAGLCAPAGGGKSTLVQILRLILEQVLLIGQVVELSLDDFLSSQQERKERHIRTRWDVHATNADLGASCLWKLKHMQTDDSVVELPCFSKGHDDRLPEPRIVRGKVALIVFEGWRIGVDHPNFEPFNSPIDLLMYLRVDYDAIFSFKCAAVITSPAHPLSPSRSSSLRARAGTSAQSATSKSADTTCTSSMVASTKSTAATTAAWLTSIYCPWRAGATSSSRRTPSIT
jgi:energy-coupling factor transporter ATP-binding protein EcfA2